MADHLFRWFVNALVPAAIFVVFALARRYLPAPPKLADSDASSDTQSARYRTTQWLFGITMVLIGLGFAWLIHALLVSLNRHYATSQGEWGLSLYPQTATWWFLPGFGALVLSYEATLLLWSILSGQRNADLYDNWSSNKAGFDGRKILRWMFVVVVLPIGILSALALPMHATLGRDGIVDCGYGFSPCSYYRYADARRMTEVQGFRGRDGKLTNRAGIVLDFSDGRRWSSSEWGDFERTVDPELVKFLKGTTGLQLEQAVTEADIPSSPIRGISQ